MWTKGLEGEVCFSIRSFTADLHICLWTFFTLQKKGCNHFFLFQLLCPYLCCMSHCLLFYSRWMPPPQLFVCFSSFYWQLLAPLNTCLCKSSFSLQKSSSTDVLLLSVAHHSVPFSMCLFLCFTLLCVSPLICAVKKSSASLSAGNWKEVKAWSDGMTS